MRYQARLRTASLLVLALAASGAPAEWTNDRLVGTWRADIEHEGQKGAFEVRFELDDRGFLNGVLSLPTIDAWEIATVPARIEGDRVLVGRSELRPTDDGALAGILPEALVPVYRIPFELRRVEATARAEREPIDAPRREPLWTVDLQSPIWAGAALATGRAYVGSDDGRVRAIDASSGEILWTYETGGPIRATPVLDGDRLIANSDDGSLHVLEAATGKSLWTVRLSDSPIDRSPDGAEARRYNHYASRPTLEGTDLFIGTHDGDLLALDRATGERRWSFSAGETITSTPAVAEGRVVFADFAGHVYALDARTGEERWRYATGAAVPSSPAIVDGIVVIGSRSYDLLGLDLESGKRSWNLYYWYSWIESSAVPWGDKLYIGSSDGQHVTALNARDGSIEWRFDSNGSAWASPAVSEEIVYIGAAGVADYIVAHEGSFFALDRATGEPLWHFPLERPGDAARWGFAASPVVGEFVVLVGDLAGKLRAFRP